MNAGAVARVLVVAGHDPSGAGVDADRAALLAAGASGAFVVTARTDQDAGGVRSIGARAPDAWLVEAEAELAHAPSALKFGLLPGPAHVATACALVRRARVPFVVLDPVIAASSGGRFLDAAGVDALIDELVPLGVIATPNVVELAEIAARLAPGRERDLARDVDARVDVARALVERGARGVIVKGGHGREDPVVDWVVAAGHAPRRLEHPRVPGGKVRGSGCRFASFLAARLALGRDLASAASEARAHVVGLFAPRA